ncbi:hypothetical protein HKD37_19G053579 [Glycine soja]
MPMASRKRKSIASIPATQYDSRYTDNILGRNILPERNVKIYHTEFDEFKVELERRNLHKRLTNLQDGSIDVVVVKELYANLYTLEDQAPKQARVRGHLIKIDADSLNEFLQTPVVLEEGESLPTYSRLCRLSVFSYSNLAPTSHTSDLNMDRDRLVYGLVTHMDMNIGALIPSQISSMAQSNSSRLGFPTLITALCRARGVICDSLTCESLSLAINLAYIKKNCWNMDDLTVNFRGARKARARPADVPSYSTPPAPPTYATPTPAPPGPSAQDSQCFESMLLSLYQGQILLMQSLQVVAPPGTILIPSLVREGGGSGAQVPQQVQDASLEATILVPFVFKVGGTQVRQEAATPERSPQISPDPPSPMVDQSSPQQLEDSPTIVHEMPADLSTPLLEIPEDPATPVLGLTTTPPATPVLYFTDEEATQDQDTQQDDQSQEYSVSQFYAKWARLVKCRIYELAEPRHVLGEPSAKRTILRLSAQKNLEEG